MRKGAVTASVIVALVGGWFLNHLIEHEAQSDPWGIGFLVAVGVGLAVAFYFWQTWRFDRARRSRRRMEVAASVASHGSRDADRAWIAPVAILGVLGLLGVQDGVNARDHYVRPYCMYGAVSEAQLEGCMSHVTNDDINNLNTQAARFARGDTNECLQDSGPFCATAAQWNTADPGPPPGQ